LVFATDLEQVEEIGGGGAHADGVLFRGWRRVGNVDRAEVARALDVFLHLDASHVGLERHFVDETMMTRLECVTNSGRNSDSTGYG